MPRFRMTVTEIATFGGQFHVRCTGASPAFAPGQLGLARAVFGEGGQPFLRQPVFPVAEPAAWAFWTEAGHPGAALEPGTELDLAGPVGRAIRWPPRAAHLLLVSGSLTRLWPAMWWALAQGWAVTWLWPDGLPDGVLAVLPAAVEALSGPPTAETVAWADVAVLDVPQPAAAARRLRSLSPLRPADFVQAVCLPALPCGFGGCQACWVETRRGRRLACIDGPILPV